MLYAIGNDRNLQNESNKLTIIEHIGKVIIVLTFIASLNPYILIFTVPVFIIGAILVWISNLRTKVKAFWTFLPILLWYPSFYLFMYLSSVVGTATAQKLDFVFPIDFEGKVIVVENMPCGQPVKTENGREQLFIPENGILLYSGELKAGYVNHKYFRLLPNGQKTELPERANYMYFDSEKQKPSTSIEGAWLLGLGNGTNTQGNHYSYLNLLVASKDSAEKYYEFQYTKNIETLTDSLVNHCK